MNELGWLAAAALLTAGGEISTEKALDMSQMATARDGDIAIREELCAARKIAKVSAYDRFIARHPTHPLAEVAKKERMELQSRTGSSR